MQVTNLNPDLLVVCHCYHGDRQQVLELRPYFEHHEAPIVIISPVDSQVHGIGPHICRVAGGVGYIGQVTWDRQHLQLRTLLEYPQKWFLLNDSDSFCLLPKIPEELLQDDNVVYSNQVDDFRVKMPEFGPHFHDPYPKIAMQPPYLLHRNALEKMVRASYGMQACPVCPFIDWWFVPVCYAAGVKHARYPFCASCENVTELGRAVMRECVVKRRAQFIHSVKTGAIAKDLVDLYNRTWTASS